MRRAKGIITDNVRIKGNLDIYKLYDMMGRIISEREGINVTYKITPKDEETIMREREWEEKERRGENGLQM